MSSNQFYERPVFLMVAAGLGFFLLSFLGMGIAPWTSLRTVTEIAKDKTNPYYEADGSLSSIGRGKAIYVSEGCWHCHSQFVRPVAGEPFRYGPASQAWESRFDIPQMFGTRRVGPDLSREAGRRSDDWHIAHLYNPRSTVPQSVMPSYRWLFEETANGPVPKQQAKDLVAYLQNLGVHFKEDIQSLVYPRLFKISGYPVATPDGLARGELLFSQNCSGCHGTGGAGPSAARYFLKPRPPDFNDRFVSSSEVYSILNRGVLGSAMPSFREMPAQDLWVLAEFVSHKGRFARETAANFREDNKGIVEAGRALYQQMCVTCHGPGGEGNGPAAAGLNPRPKDFTRRSFTPEAFANLVTRGVEGSAMPPFPLDERQVKSLAAYVAGFYNGEL